MQKNNQGRVALLVEGDAGWGKDFILDKTIQLWLDLQPHSNLSYVHIIANPDQWSSLVSHVKQAMEQGYPLAISELNLLSSSDLEGLLNSVLTGDAKPGFRLMATVNPGEYIGREAMTPALKSRCTRIRLSALSLDDLEAIVSRIPDVKDPLPSWFAIRFHQAFNELNLQKSSVQLTLDDLFTTVELMKDKPEQQWKNIFDQNLSFSLQAIYRDLQSPEDYRLDMNRQQIDKRHLRQLEQVANSVNDLPHPIRIVRNTPICQPDCLGHQ